MKYTIWVLYKLPISKQLISADTLRQSRQAYICEIYTSNHAVKICVNSWNLWQKQAVRLYTLRQSGKICGKKKATFTEQSTVP
jgi:hypothetical protein